MKAKTQFIIRDGDTRRNIFKVLLSFLILLSVLYIYLIGSITFNILARKSLESNIREVGNQVGNLELEYLTLSGNINTNLGLSLGFTNANGTIFATKTITRVAIR